MSETIDRYRILTTLGQGGMGLVYRARDERLLRDVALKVITPGVLVDDAARVRFRREALALSQLNHPNICTIFEIGEADGRSFIAMEFVEGSPLSTLIAARALTTQSAMRYASQIADALAHAHDRGVVHRDLKPANVVITPEGRVKVLDFGVAKWTAHPDSETLAMDPVTQAGHMVGTVGYMAPELLRGGAADRRSDIWALGVLLYEMATGELPFRGQSRFEISSAVLREPAPALPDMAPTGLHTLVQKCLAKEPGLRYQQASEVRAVLDVVASPLSSTRETLQQPVSRVLSDGTKASSSAEANRYYETAALALSQYDLARMQKMLTRALEADPEFAGAWAFQGWTHWMMIDAGFSSDSSLLYQAEENFRRALALDPDSPAAHAGFSAVFFFQRQKDLVPRELSRGLKRHPDHHGLLNQLIWFYWIGGDFAALEVLAKRVIDAYPLFWPCHLVYGDALRHIGRTQEAICEQEIVLEQDPRNLYALRFLARAQIDTGDLAAARETLELAPAGERRGYWKIVSALVHLGQGKPGEAEAELDAEVLKYASFVPWYTAEVAAYYAALGEADTALEWLERAVRNGDERLEWFEREPLFAKLHGTPRFRQILESVGYRRALRRETPTAS